MDEDVENQVKQEKNTMEPIIRVEHLCKTFDVRDNTVHAAKDISFDIERRRYFWNYWSVGRRQEYTGALPEPIGEADLRQGACGWKRPDDAFR